MRSLLEDAFNEVGYTDYRWSEVPGKEPCAWQSTWHTFTEEEPNSLTVDELPRFMAKARMLCPQHFAMLALGVATGRRPCELRPLRRRGDKPDVLWDEGIVLIRRSDGRLSHDL